MNILFDYQTFVQQQYGGISKCFVELIKHFPNEVCPEICVLKTKNYHLLHSDLVPDLRPALFDKTDFLKMPFIGSRRLYSLIKNNPVFQTIERVNQKNTIKRLIGGNFDIFHPTYFDDYFLNYIGNKPFVLTIHDMTPELFLNDANNFQIRMKKKLAPLASAIIAVSENTKKDVVNLLHVPEEKVHVIYHGCPSKTDCNIKPLINSEYFLYVGQRSGYKNFSSLIMEFRKVHKLFPSVKLVCTASDFNKSELNLLRENGLEGTVIHLSADDKTLISLYTFALAYVSPSLYEGFGMPILESFTYGCPVILNKASCFPEIAKDAALYFESDGTNSNISDVLIEFLNDISQRDSLIARGYERANAFSWKKASQQLCDVYRSILLNK